MRILTNISIAAVFFFFSTEMVAGTNEKEIKALYHTLDSLIECQDSLISEKKAKSDCADYSNWDCECRREYADKVADPQCEHPVENEDP